jgi:hypothetical protein
VPQASCHAVEPWLRATAAVPIQPGGVALEGNNTLQYERSDRQS